MGGLVPWILGIGIGIALGAYIWNLEKRAAINAAVKNWWNNLQKKDRKKKRKARK